MPGYVLWWDQPATEHPSGAANSVGCPYPCGVTRQGDDGSKAPAGAAAEDGIPVGARVMRRTQVRLTSALIAAVVILPFLGQSKGALSGQSPAYAFHLPALHASPLSRRAHSLPAAPSVTA